MRNQSLKFRFSGNLNVCLTINLDKVLLPSPQYRKLNSSIRLLPGSSILWTCLLETWQLNSLDMSLGSLASYSRSKICLILLLHGPSS